MTSADSGRVKIGSQALIVQVIKYGYSVSKMRWRVRVMVEVFGCLSEAELHGSAFPSRSLGTSEKKKNQQRFSCLVCCTELVLCIRDIDLATRGHSVFESENANVDIASHQPLGIQLQR